MFKKSLYIPSTIKFMKNKNYFVFLDNANNAHIISVNIPQNVYIRKTKSLLLISFETSHNKKLLSWFIFLKNLFKGLSNPFFVRLILRGVGFKSLSTIDAIELKLGYSHSAFLNQNP